MAKLIIVLSGLLLCLFLLHISIKYVRKLWWNPIMLQRMMKRQGISGPPYKFMYGNAKDMADMRKNSAAARPLQAHSHQVFSRIQPEVQAWVAKYGSNYLFWRGPDAELAVTEAELIKEILNNKDGVYGKGDQRLFVKKLLGDGVLITDGAKWAKLRKLSNHAFHGESLKGMFPAMVQGVEMLLRRWRDDHREGREVEVYKEFSQLSAEVISRTAFGSSYREGEKIFSLLMKLIELAARNLFTVQIPLLSFGKSSDEMEADEINKELREILVRMITSREVAEIDREAPGSFGDDFLASLVRAKNSGDPNNRITLEEMVDECKTFYFAGQETLNSSLTWTMYLLALHQDWQDEVRKEVGRVFGQNAPDPEGLARLKTMGMVVNEALRLYPPTAGVTRRVQKKVRLGNLTLPADMNLFIPTLWCHYNPDVWGQDAHRFKPERFAEGIAKATGHNMTAFMPFGLGQRNCVGSSFATAEVKTTLCMILQRFSFSLSPAYVHSPCLQVTLRPQHGVQLILHPL